MTIEQLQYFMAIIKFKNFSVAAEECFISQSSLSKQIKALEQELGGVELFKRNTKRIEVTIAGKEFYVSADKILAEHQQMLKNMKKYTEMHMELLNIGTIPVLDHYGLTDVLFRFQEYYSNIQIHIIESTSKSLVEKFSRGKFDVGFFRDSCLPSGNFSVFPLVDDQLVLVVSRNHPLAKYDCIDLKQVEQETFLFVEGMSETCHNCCVAAGFV